MKSKSRIDKTEYKFILDEYNSKFWLKNELRHRDKDLPAIISSSGNMFWYKNGERHRDNDKPAMVYRNGYMSWYINGKLIKGK